MSGTLVFNHHSLPFDQSSLADAAIPDFLKICVEAINVGVSTILVDTSIDGSWFRLELSHRYFFQDWYNKYREGEHQDKLRAFRTIVTRQPFLSSRDIEKGAELFDVRLFDISYTALTAAAWHMAPIISFETREPWCTNPLTVNIEKIDIDTEDVVADSVDIPNYFSYAVFLKSLSALLAERDALISSGQELLAQFDTLYPLLILCGKSKQQLSKWSACTTIFNQVKKSLLALSSFSEKWQSGQFPFYSIDNLKKSGMPYRVSCESECVHNNPALKKERMFWLPSGVECFFEDHIKLANGYRIHFYPHYTEKKIYVGYIGPHLRLS